MKRYLEYITEAKKSVTHDEWFTAVRNHDVNKLKELIDRGADINMVEGNGYTALLMSTNYSDDIVNLLLEQPGIDVNIKDNCKNYNPLLYAAIMDKKGIVEKILKNPNVDVYITDENNKDFIEKINWNKREFLKDYDLQKTIIENNFSNILLFKKYGLLNPKIEEEYSDLFKAGNWGLIS